MKKTKKFKCVSFIFMLGIVAFYFTGLGASAATEVIYYPDLKPSDISIGDKFTSGQYQKGIMGTRQVVKFSNTAATSHSYKVGGLVTQYYDTKIVAGLEMTFSSGYTETEVITTQLQISALMEGLVGVGAKVTLADSIIANLSESCRMQTQVTGSFTQMNSTSFTNESVIEVTLDTNTIDRTKESVALGYVTKYIRFKIEESYDEENRIFVGWTKKDNAVKKDYYGYVFTYSFQTWIYDNGKCFGTVGNIRQIEKDSEK